VRPTGAGGRVEGSEPRLWLVPLAATGLILQMAIVMLLSVSGDAPTNDEPAHIGAGVAYTQRHDLRFSPEHPPVAKILAAVPLLVARVHLPSRESASYRNGDSFGFGRELLFSSGNDPRHVIWLARLPMVILTLALALAVFGFSRDLFGAAPALLSLALVTLCPTVIAHGRLVTTDVAGALFVLCTAWFLWKAAAGRPWTWLALAGVSFGLALGSKLSVIFFVPAMVGLSLARALSSRHSDESRRTTLVALVAWPLLFLTIAVATVWLVYLAVDPKLRFDVPKPLAADARGGLARLADAVPLPEPYRVGLRLVVGIDQSERGSYLFGEYYRGGRPYYYPALLLMKTPISTVVLWMISMVAVARSPARWRTVAFVGLPPATFLLVAVFSSINIGIRHVVVVPIFLAVAAGAVATLRLAARPFVIGALVMASAASIWMAFPQYLQYVNEAFGGRSRAPELVSDSNVDWGQDLRRLSTYLDRRFPGQPVWLAYFGTSDPAAYGLGNAREPTSVPPAEVKGVVAVSVTFVNSLARHRYDFITERHRPIATVGNSILVYEID